MNNFKLKNELDRMHGLNMYDHSARMSAPALCRWQMGC